MNAELEITSAVAAIREADRPGIDRMASGPARRRDRASAQNQTIDSARLMVAGDRGTAVANPWPDRPRFSRNRRRVSDEVRALGYKPAVVFLSAAILGAGVFRVAEHLGISAGPVVVHLVWPV